MTARIAVGADDHEAGADGAWICCPSSWTDSWPNQGRLRSSPSTITWVLSPEVRQSCAVRRMCVSWTRPDPESLRLTPLSA